MPAAPPPDFQSGGSLTGSAWHGILAATAPLAAAAAAAAATVAKAHIDQRGETQRAVIAAEVARERIRQPELPPDGA